MTDGFGWTDYSVEADVQPLSNGNTKAAGLRFRFEAPYPSPNTCACDLFRNNVGAPYLNLYCWGVTNEITPFAWSSGNTYRLRATAVANTATCEVVG